MVPLRPVLLVPAVVAVALLSAPPAPPVRHQQAPVLPRPEALRWLFASHRHLVTDLYWLRTTYQTGIARTEEEYRDVASYVELVTDLDPKFRYAYVFGTVIVPFNRGREQWMNTAESTRIAEKGLRQFPDDVYLGMLLAYNLAYFHHEYRRAADLLARTAGLPGAPGYLAPLATRLYAMGDSFDAAVALADLMGSETTDPQTREFFERRKQEILLEKTLREIDEAAARYREAQGRPPTTVVELLGSGYLRTFPIDPLGGTISIDAKGRARSSSTEARLRTFLPKDHPDAE
jgi:hypothetical protein